jgi:manganese/zinc/iron transport system permease protein
MFTYTFLLILGGTAFLGFASGVVGSIMVVRRTALLGDVISHAMVPGIAVVLLLYSLEYLHISAHEQYMILYAGGVLSGVLGLVLLHGIRRHTVLKNDAGLAIVLSVLFGLGISILGIVQQSPGIYVAAIESYLYGNAAGLRIADVYTGAGLCLLVVITVSVCYRPFFLISFDQAYARLKGISVGVYEFLYFSLVLLVCVLGIQTVGVLLLLALLIIPAVTMRFWTHSFSGILWGAGLLGAFSASAGTYVSSLLHSVPSGPAIVMTAVFLFLVSFLIAPRRGIVWNALRDRRYQKRSIREHIFRFWFEHLEKSHGRTGEYGYMKDVVLTKEEICAFEASLPSRKLAKLLHELITLGYVVERAEGKFSLSPRGVLEAERIVHQHRLWELFLLEYADIAPEMIDRSADRIEHVLEPDIVRELEALLAQNESAHVIKSPHPIG